MTLFNFLIFRFCKSLTMPFLIAILLIWPLFASCQAPPKMSYQAVIRNTSGQLVVNTSVGIRVSILQGAPSGPVLFSETYNPNPRTNSHVS